MALAEWPEHSKRAFDCLMKAIVVSSAFLLIELLAGYYSNSLAIFADATHVLSDVVSFGLAGYAIACSAAPGNRKHTFGKARLQIISALGEFGEIFIHFILLIQVQF